MRPMIWSVQIAAVVVTMFTAAPRAIATNSQGCDNQCPSDNSCGGSYCVAYDNGKGTVESPLAMCEYSGGTLVIREGLPKDSALLCDYSIGSFSNIVTEPGGSLGGSRTTCGAALTLWMRGSGIVGTFRRTITIPIQCEFHSGPPQAGQVVQHNQTDLQFLVGQLPPGDPDFDLLRISAGSLFGMPSPGHCTLTQMPDANWGIDSFFDVTYRFDFVGAPGSALAGMSGSTAGEPPVHAATGGALPLAPMNAQGSADTPAPGLLITPPFQHDNVPPSMMFQITEGLPAGSGINVEIEFVPLSLMSAESGGALGGVKYELSCNGNWRMRGTGGLAGYERTFVLPHVFECHVSPIDPTAAVQELENVTFRLSGQLPPGDPDFDLLRISAGDLFGLPSPGHTRLTRMPEQPGIPPRWHVDSFFDITCRIDFVGTPGGPFAGMSGSTQSGPVRMVQGGPVPRYTIDGFGMPHTEMGQAKLKSVVTGVEMFRIENVGTSGNDGVEILLRRIVVLKDVQDGVTLVFEGGMPGWRGMIDFGPSGALPQGCMMRATGVIKGVGTGTGGGAGAAMPALNVAALADGSGILSLEPCDPAGTCNCATGVGCAPGCCPGDPAASLTVELLSNGNVVASQTYPGPPYPNSQIAGNFGTQIAADGTVHPPRYSLSIFVTHFFSGQPQVQWQGIFTQAEPIPMKLADGSGYVIADAVRFVFVRSPEASVVPVVEQLQITGANVAAVGPGGGPGVIILGKEGEAHTSESMEFIVERVERARMGGGGDLDGDGLPDLVVSDFGASGSDGVSVCCADLDRDGWPDRMASMNMQMIVLDTAEVAPDGTLVGGELPPNAALRFTPRLSAAQQVKEVTVSATRCASGTCSTVDLNGDFSELGATSMRVEAYLADKLVTAVDGVTGPTVGSGPVFMIRNVSKAKGDYLPPGSGLGSGPEPDAVTLRFVPTSLTIAPGMPPVHCDALHIKAENQTVFPTELLSMQLTGTNICGAVITDIDGDPLPPPPPPCPADIAPPGGNGVVNVSDLLAVINAWGTCAQPCPPHCNADIIQNCVVNVSDLLAVINAWGPCP